MRVLQRAVESRARSGTGRTLPSASHNYKKFKARYGIIQIRVCELNWPLDPQNKIELGNNKYS